MDFAQALKNLSDTQIILVQDNLNTDKPASFYEVSPAAEARRLVERFERVYTPEHGNWLNLTESELCLVGSSPRITAVAAARTDRGRALAICCRC